jgi:hypothetical protein
MRTGREANVQAEYASRFLVLCCGHVYCRVLPRTSLMRRCGGRDFLLMWSCRMIAKKGTCRDTEEHFGNMGGECLLLFLP